MSLNPISSALEPPRGAVVVGASAGIGAALARRLAREGYALGLVARGAEALEALCAQINAEAGRPLARPYAHDVTQAAEVPGLFQAILRDLGRVDLVVYNAGLLIPVELAEFNFEKDRAMFAVNVLGAMAWLNQAAMLFERQGHGQIAGIASIAGERGRIGAPAYNASKAALNSYLESLRNRLTRRGVHVLTVRPGFVQTQMLRHSPRTFWVISPEQAADDIWNALRARKQVVYSPARWRWAMLVIRNIPSFVFRRMSF
jgi:short-subunit dehydrogenase